MVLCGSSPVLPPNMMSVLSLTLRNENSLVGGGILPVVATGDQISESKLMEQKKTPVLYHIIISNCAVIY